MNHLSKNKPNVHLVGIGDWAHSNDPRGQIRTLGLGSCVAIIVTNTAVPYASMAHVVLPDSKLDTKKAEDKPSYFADTAVEFLIREAVGSSRGKDFHDLRWTIIGGANIVAHEEECVFNIGKRNALAIRKKMFREGIAPHAEELGGNKSRTTWVDINTGHVYFQIPGQPAVLIS